MNTTKDILYDCFQVAYWLGKAGASDVNTNYLRTRELTIERCMERLLRLQGKEIKHDSEGSLQGKD